LYSYIATVLSGGFNRFEVSFDLTNTMESLAYGKGSDLRLFFITKKNQAPKLNVNVGHEEKKIKKAPSEWSIFRTLLTSEDPFSDFVVCAENSSYKVHKSILACKSNY